MSLNCFSIPFRFTIMMAARTAWDRKGVSRADEQCPGAAKLSHPGVIWTKHSNLHNSDLTLGSSNS